MLHAGADSSAESVEKQRRNLAGKKNPVEGAAVVGCICPSVTCTILGIMEGPLGIHVHV